MDWKTFGISLASYLLPVIAAILSALAAYGLRYLAKKWKIDLDLAQDAAIRTAVRSAIAGAEEMASRKLKLEPGKAVPGSEKAQWVFDRVNQMFPDLININLHKMIDEELAQIRGVGATGDRVVGIDSAPTNGIPANLEIEK
jgi:hypothetical protein